jgi:uncharacterized membrane protein YedE/YeeE
VGLAVALGWLFTFRASQSSFDLVQVKSISFIGPSADTLMGLINAASLQLGFDTGLVPGVFAGFCWRRSRPVNSGIQGFKDGPSMMIGAALMGFGGMLAGGCAVGAGVTGGAIFALTAWMALAAMWVGAPVTNLLVDERFANSTIPEEAVRAAR